MPSQEKKKARSWPVIRAYAKAAAKYPLLLSLVLIGNLIIQGAGIAAPLYLQKFVDRVASLTPSEAAVGGLIGLLVTFAVINFIGWIGQRIQIASEVSAGTIHRRSDLTVEVIGGSDLSTVDSEDNGAACVGLARHHCLPAPVIRQNES